MRIGLLTDALADLPLEQALEWVDAEAGAIRDVELGAGGFSPAPHCTPSDLLADSGARDRWLEAFARHGISICALNVSGNPLHPDAGWAARDDAALRDTIRLAATLGVDRVVAMSGCPGPPGGPAPAPHFVAGGFLPDFEGILDWQWRERILPYWHELSAFASEEAPDLRICLELHPGACVYNLPTYRWIAEAGPNLLVNLDPSHFLWQGIDPLVIIDELGDAIGFVHAKDTRINARNLARVGILDCRTGGQRPIDPSELPWTFATVGNAHGTDWWGEFIRGLDRAGYDGVLSIEYEDPLLDPKRSVLLSMASLEAAMEMSAGGAA